MKNETERLKNFYIKSDEVILTRDKLNPWWGIGQLVFVFVKILLL